MTTLIARIAGIAAFLLAHLAFASAGELRVYSTIGVQAALEELAPKFEKASGYKLNITWNTAAQLAKRIQAGEQADVVVLVKASTDLLLKDGKVVAGSEATFASSGLAAAVKKGAAKPDVSSPEAFKKTLLAAKTITYSNPAGGGASGVYFAKALERAGIADELKAKTKFPPTGVNAANLVASGEAELAIAQTPEAMGVAGLDVAAPLPGDFNNITAYSAGIATGTKESATGAALIKFLQAPEAQEVFKARGLDPAPPAAKAT